MTLNIQFDASASPGPLAAICEGLVLQNVEQMRLARQRGIVLPRLYQSRAVYRRDPPGREWFRSASRVFRPEPSWCGSVFCPQCRAATTARELCGPVLLWFDCDDGAGIVAAEHRFYGGLPSRVEVVQTQRPGLLHAVVRRPDGVLEDPTQIVRSIRR